MNKVLKKIPKNHIIKKIKENVSKITIKIEFAKLRVIIKIFDTSESICFFNAFIFGFIVKYKKKLFKEGNLANLINFDEITGENRVTDIRIIHTCVHTYILDRFHKNVACLFKNG